MSDAVKVLTSCCNLTVDDIDRSGEEVAVVTSTDGKGPEDEDDDTSCGMSGRQ